MRVTKVMLEALAALRSKADPGLIYFQYRTRLALLQRKLITNGAHGYKLIFFGRKILQAAEKG